MLRKTHVNAIEVNLHYSLNFEAHITETISKTNYMMGIIPCCFEYRDEVFFAISILLSDHILNMQTICGVLVY